MLDRKTDQVFDSKQEESELADVLKKQCGFYRVVLELARNEHEKYTSQAPLSEIIPIMKKKKILLDCIEELEEKSKRLLQNSDGIKEQRSVLESLVAEIYAIDQVNEKVLVRYMNVLEKKRNELLQKSSKKKSK
jgi:hypothetical protein